MAVPNPRLPRRFAPCNDTLGAVMRAHIEILKNKREKEKDLVVTGI
jgi:hypothetical protein